jgi:hypothetical protein
MVGNEIATGGIGEVTVTGSPLENVTVLDAVPTLLLALHI